jgi:hypothetical protein
MRFVTSLSRGRLAVVARGPGSTSLSAGSYEPSVQACAATTSLAKHERLGRERSPDAVAGEPFVVSLIRRVR